MTPYTKEFYDLTSKERVDSAQEIMPFILTIYEPRSIVDVGCARGEWLREAKMRIPDLPCTGIDGPYVDPGDRCGDIIYIEADFEQGLPIFDIGKIDLGLCLEVGEHLTPAAGEELVSWLCRHCERVVWSAAIPMQGGVNHINEQWQSYWEGLFHARGFYPSLEIRAKVWNNNKVQPYYAQNIITYSPEASGVTGVLDVVHPRMWSYKINALRG